MYIHSGIQTKKVEKCEKSEVVELYLEPCKISMTGRFYENATVKIYIIDVWYDSKNTPEALQDSKIKLKWMNPKMLEKTLHIQGRPYRGYQK